MSQPTIVPSTWRGLPALRVTGDGLDALVSLIGGHLASLRLPGDDIDPLWQPAWTAADPAALTPAEHARLGGWPASPLLATIGGSSLCCDRFGPAWPGEAKPVHGEVATVHFARVPDANAHLAIEGLLPLADLRVRRALRLEGDEAVWTTTVSHAGGSVRDIEWCEHTNLGGTFLDGAAFAADLDRVLVSPSRDDGERFATAPIGRDLPIAEALAMPAVNAAPCGDVLGGRVSPGTAPGSWSASNARLRRRLTCTFARGDWPWLALWTQHRSRTGTPWNGVERVRGMELSTKPFPEGLPPAERRSTYLGRPTTCPIPPGAGATRTLRFRWERF